MASERKLPTGGKFLSPATVEHVCRPVDSGSPDFLRPAKRSFEAGFLKFCPANGTRTKWNGNRIVMALPLFRPRSKFQSLTFSVKGAAKLLPYL